MNQQISFGEFLLTDEKLKLYLDKKSYKQYLNCKTNFRSLSLSLAEKLANAIKSWAVSLGATHYTHWFFPLTNKTAEKQVSFLDKRQDKILPYFNGTELLKGEVDASSFPSGSERLTFEARGYTVWDYTSPIFIKEDNNGHRVVYIPTAFCTYHGVAVDEKTPLLRACEFLNKEGTQLLRTLGYKKTKQVLSFVGGEQEYFLLDQALAKQRKDIMITGRTLFGSNCLLDQRYYQHYLGVLSPKISAFMHELNKELWKVGILAKLQHNEVSPAQHEIVPIYAPAGVSCDQNMLLMLLCEQVAKRHGIKVLLHEKPFKNLNGSGKHNNWSIGTDDGMNLLEENKVGTKVFMFIFSCIIAGIDKYYDLLRCTIMSAGNEHRLGGHEAPPSLISVYIGEELQQKIEEYIHKRPRENKKSSMLETQSSVLSKIEKDGCDRNRTSPFAFTGTKFEFRMVGSSQNMAFCNTILNTIVANEFKKVNHELKQTKNIEQTLFKLTKNNFEKHSRIIFNGDSYSKEWMVESRKRGLKDCPYFEKCCDILLEDTTKELLTKNKIMSEVELDVRYKTMLEKYTEQNIVEAKVMLSMLNTEIIPQLEQYLVWLLNIEKKIISKNKSAHSFIKSKEILQYISQLISHSILLQKMLKQVKYKSNKEIVVYIRKFIAPKMREIRAIYDQIEPILPKKYRAIPNYDELLFSLDNE